MAPTETMISSDTATARIAYSADARCSAVVQTSDGAARERHLGRVAIASWRHHDRVKLPGAGDALDHGHAQLRPSGRAAGGVRTTRVAPFRWVPIASIARTEIDSRLRRGRVADDPAEPRRPAADSNAR